MSEAIKACPFCGSTATLQHGMGEAWVRCDNEECNAVCSGRSTGQDAKAIGYWNRRADSILAVIGEGQEPVATIEHTVVGSIEYCALKSAFSLPAGVRLSLYTAPQPAPDAAAMQEVIADEFLLVRLGVKTVANELSVPSWKERIEQEANRTAYINRLTECVKFLTKAEARIAELERVQGVLVGALEDAATSLETIQLRSFGEESYLDSKPQMRAFAGARAGIARAALAAAQQPEGGAHV